MRKSFSSNCWIKESKDIHKMSCKSNCSCIVCHVRNMRQEKLVNGVSWSEILRFEADSPVLSHVLRPCDSYMLELNDKFLPSICRIQDAWRAFQENRKGVCMDCGAPFKDFLRCPSAKTHDGVPRCEQCEKCYANDCPICLESVAPMAKNSCITECGHVFHLECMMRHNLNSSSCPMCRNPLEKRNEDFIRQPVQPEIHWQAEASIREEAYNDGYEQGISEQEEAEIEMMQLCEDISGDNDLPRFVMNTVNDLQVAVRELEGSRVREQAAYDSGVVDGRSIANEDIALLRAGKESLERQVDIINKELKLLR